MNFQIIFVTFLWFYTLILYKEDFISPAVAVIYLYFFLKNKYIVVFYIERMLRINVSYSIIFVM